jgi:hypothetical protein
LHRKLAESAKARHGPVWILEVGLANKQCKFDLVPQLCGVVSTSVGGRLKNVN